jgi:hypothetical protein
MDLKDFQNCNYYNFQSRREENKRHYCKKCNEKLYPYCVKHNDPIKPDFCYISCGAIQCRQNFVSYYSPTKGCKHCQYGQYDNCRCTQTDYPKGCMYCQHPLINGVQIFKCEIPF